jgi:hypothetical protein
MEMIGRDGRSIRVVLAATVAVLALAALPAVPSKSTAARGGSCKGPASLGSYFDLAKGRKIATRKASCGKAQGVAKAFSRSCERAYMRQLECKVKAGGKWGCRSRMLGKNTDGAPARVKCRKKRGRVAFVVGWFPPVELSVGSQPDARAPTAPVWKNGCIDTTVPYEAVDAPSLANFEVRVVKGGVLDLGDGIDLQESMIAHDDWGILRTGLNSKPRIDPGRIPIMLTPGSLPGNAYGVMEKTCFDDSYDAIAIAGKYSQSQINETTMHELFHAFSRGRGTNTWQDTWWEEASATWSQAKGGYGEDAGYDNQLQFPNVPLDFFKFGETHQYAMARFVQFLEDRGYVVSGPDWPLQRFVIDKYPSATDTLDQVLRTQGTSLGREAAAFWGDRIRKKPSHGPRLIVGADGTRYVEIAPGSETIPVSAGRLRTKLNSFYLQGNVSRVELEFHPDPGSYFWAGIEPNTSVPAPDGTTLSFCAEGEGTGGEMKWPEPPETVPVTFTNGNLSDGQLSGEIEVRAQQNSPECNSDEVPGNRACRILADAGVSNIFGNGVYPFYNSSSSNQYSSWLCFYEGDGTEVNFNLYHYRNTTTKEVRNTVKKQIDSLNLQRINVGDLAGIGTETIDGKPATIMTIASGREIIFLIVGPGGRNGTIQLGKRIVGQID